MRLIVVGSGSSGNTYILDGEKEALVIECGLPFLEVKKALNFNIRKIVGCVVSHVHGDHAKNIKQYEDAGIKVFKPYDGDEKVPFVSGFKIQKFPLLHDVPCFGFLIDHEEMGRLVYASDTEYIKYRFKNVNHFLIEANHTIEHLSTSDGKYEHQLKGHMNIDTACGFLKANVSEQAKSVTLCHLSVSCGDPEYFRERASSVAGFDVNIAKKGLAVEL